MRKSKAAPRHNQGQNSDPTRKPGRDLDPNLAPNLGSNWSGTLFRGPIRGGISDPTMVVLLFLVATAVSIPLLDQPAHLIFQNPPHWLHQIARDLSRIGDSSWSIPLFAAAALFFTAIGSVLTGAGAALTKAWRNASFFVLCCLVSSGLATIIFKSIIGRARPDVAGEGNLAFHHFTHSSDWASFPSGHTTTAMALAFALGLVFPKARGAFIAIAVMVAASRVILGVHWVSDTIAGTLVAWLALRAMIWIFRRTGLHLPAGERAY